MRRWRSESGAAAVEFALVVPLLVTLVFGITDFASVYSSQASLSAAARQGARVMALQNSTSAAVTATLAAAPTLKPALTSAQVSISPATCTPGSNATVTITYPMTSVSGFFTQVFKSKNLTGKAVMRCSG